MNFRVFTANLAHNLRDISGEISDKKESELMAILNSSTMQNMFVNITTNNQKQNEKK